MSRPALGATIGGKYQILRQLGEGGMGSVYEAENLLTHKHAAIKWVHPQTDNNAAYERLLHEARAASRVSHRNVVDVYDVVHEGEGIFLVMELLVGEPLCDFIERGSMPLHELIAVLLPAMRGVAAAHAVGVIHRDIKPENIFLALEPGNAGPVPKVIDFGISKVSAADVPSLTRSGITMGTPRYVSYEQLLGARDVDARTDVYAFGVILYEAITGEAPYHANTFGEQAVAFATEVPKRPSALCPALPLALDRLVEEAIAKERSQRIGSLALLIERLEPFASADAFPEPLLAFRGSIPPGETKGPSPHETTAPATKTPDPEPLPVSVVMPWSGPPPQPTPKEQAAEEALLVRTGSRLRPLAAALALLLLIGALIWWAAQPQQVASPAAAPRATPASSAQSHLGSPTAVSPEPQLPAGLQPQPADLTPQADAAAVMPAAEAPSAETAPTPTTAPPQRLRTLASKTKARPSPPSAPAPAPQAAPDETTATPPEEPARDTLDSHRAGKLRREEF